MSSDQQGWSMADMRGPAYGGPGDRGCPCLRGPPRIVPCPSGSGPARHRRPCRPLRRGVRGRGCRCRRLRLGRCSRAGRRRCRQEVRQQGGFLELVGAAGGDEPGPVLEFGLPVPRLLGQVERPHLLTQDFRVEERFGFDSQLPSNRVCGCGKKPSGFGNIQHPTSNNQHPKPETASARNSATKALWISLTD